MSKKSKISLKKIKEEAIKEAKEAHNQLRIITYGIYIAIFVSWIVLKYDLLYLVAAIGIAMILRILIAIWLFRTKFPKKIEAQK